MTANTISHEDAARLLDYNSVTGAISWRIARGRAKQGDVAGRISANGYREIRLLGRGYLAHRLAWLLHFEEWPRSDIDHVNSVRDDNRIVNLRLCTPSQNAGNRKVSTKSASGLKGVYFDKRCPNRPWAAFIRCAGGGKSLGHFVSKEEASEVYMRAARQYFGEFARAA